MYIYRYILLNIICSVLIMLLISMFLGMTVSGQIIGVLSPEKDHLFCSQSFLFVYSSFCRIEASWAFPPIHFGMSLGILLVQLTSGWSFKRNFMGVASDIIRRQNITENSLTLRIL